MILLVGGSEEALRKMHVRERDFVVLGDGAHRVLHCLVQEALGPVLSLRSAPRRASGARRAGAQ
eukprot:9639685-Alexandrium_andersonii.AAC.1